jgi:hypothetical protein
VAVIVEKTTVQFYTVAQSNSECWFIASHEKLKQADRPFLERMLLHINNMYFVDFSRPARSHQFA